MVVDLELQSLNPHTRKPISRMKTYDYLIVGSGLFGATFAHLAQQQGKRCLVVERRPHTGGNIWCRDVDGIHVHHYGAHIFHTSNREVWDFVNRLVPFNRYTNSPLANYHGRLFNLPFNMNTFHQMWGVTTPQQAVDIIRQQRAEMEGITPQNLEQQAISLVGRDIYETLIKEYTEKQWGRPCTQLPPFIIRRLPVRLVYDNNYFTDSYQGIPIGGYNQLTDALLQDIPVRTGVDFIRERGELQQLASHTLFTGAIDEYFDYRLGKLQWRTVRFEHERLDTANYQGNAVVNYTSAEEPFTRIIEHKHFEHFGDEVYRLPFTVISREYPMEWESGMEPYYPVNDEANNRLAADYAQLAEAETNVSFGGRLAEYRYYDMAPIIEKAMTLYHQLNP